MITPLVVDTTKDPTDKRKQIFSECMHIAIENHFSGDEVLHYLGEGGWKRAMTCRCDRLTKSVSRKYFNFIKAAPVNARSKVVQFEQQIIAVKHVKHQDSVRVRGCTGDFPARKKKPLGFYVCKKKEMKK
jgi:hypothetical protein